MFTSSKGVDRGSVQPLWNGQRLWRLRILPVRMPFEYEYRRGKEVRANASAASRTLGVDRATGLQHRPWYRIPPSPASSVANSPPRGRTSWLGWQRRLASRPPICLPRRVTSQRTSSPKPATYLKTKYPELSLSAIEALAKQVETAKTSADTTEELIDDPAGGSV